MQKKMRFVVSLLLVLTQLFGCTGNAGNTGNTGNQDVLKKEEVIIGFPSIPEHFDPLRGFGGGGHSSGAHLLFSTLVETDADINIVLDLASSFTVSDDALTYTFKLRDDALFTDGTAVTVDDVLFTYQTVMQTASSIDLSMVERFETGKDEFSIILKAPRSTFILTVASIGIVPEHAYDEDFGLHPIGSGPFKLTQHDVEQQFILEANENYYGHVPEIKRVIFVKMSNEDIRMAAVNAGTVDITMTNAVLADAKPEGYYLLTEKSLDNMGIVLPVVPNTGEINQYGNPVGNNITCDINFRKALAYGIDREAICRDALNGYAAPAYTENDGMPWSNSQSKIDYDLDYAISLLEESGWVMGSDGYREKDGVRASFSLMYFANDSVRQAVALSVSQQARDNLGIEIIVAGTSSDEIKTRMFTEPMILAWGSSNPMTSYYLFHSSRAGLNDYYNPENYRSEVVDNYLDQAIAAGSIEAAIPFFQKAQWDGTSGTSMRGDCPYVFLINKTHLYWARDGLYTGRQPIHAHGDSWPLVYNLREWKWVD